MGQDDTDICDQHNQDIEGSDKDIYSRRSSKTKVGNKTIENGMTPNQKDRAHKGSFFSAIFAGASMKGRGATCFRSEKGWQSGYLVN